MATQARHHSSSSSSSSSRENQVFLSFSGQDTFNTITSILNYILRSKGLRTYMANEELKLGQEIGPALFTAIEQSAISIPIFSENYGSRKWCLRELVKMLQCHKEKKQTILPIFYYVEPNEVQDQTGSFGKAWEAFKIHQKPEDVDEWRTALEEVGRMKGLLLNESHNHGNQLEMFVERVLSKLNTIPLDVAKYPVGIASRAKKLSSFLHTQSKPQFVGICGMGGAGKTTTAMEFYNQNYKKFQGSCFLADVRDKASDLVSLQKKLLENIFGNQNQDIGPVARASNLIKERLQGKKVLIILDDVDNHEQLNALAGDPSWFGSESKIIITSRDAQVLLAAKVDEKDIYTLEGLDDDESLQLFSMHAFGEPKPPENYMQVSKDVVSYASGLPLTLEVLGSSLYGKKEKEFASLLRKLKEVPHNDVQKKLKISYDGLDEMQKVIFLDIACFFIGMGKGTAIRMWLDCRFYPEINLEILIQKSLVKIGSNNKMRMHDQLRDMGRHIVYEESPRDPGGRSRLWSYKEAMEVLKDHTGTRKVEGIFLECPLRSEINFFRVEDLTMMSNLRLLRVKNVRIEGNMEYLPSKLKWLSLKRCSLEPHNFYLEKLVHLQISNCEITEAWNSSIRYKGFENLKVLDLNNCYSLAKSPNFSGFPQLEKLSIENCPALVEVDESIGQLRRLVKLTLSATGLKELPRGICELYSLQELTLVSCRQLKELYLTHAPINEIPDGRQLEKLDKLLISGCVSLNFISELPTSLTYLEAGNCVSLERLPDLSNMKKLQRLLAYGCENLNDLQGIEGAESIEVMNGTFCKNLTSKVLFQESMYNRQLFFNHQDVLTRTAPPPSQRAVWTPHKKCMERYEIDDNMINNGMILWLVIDLREGMNFLPLRIDTFIRRNGKKIIWMNSLDFEDRQLNSRRICRKYHLEGGNWFGFPLESKDTIEIEQELPWTTKLKLKYYKILSKGDNMMETFSRCLDQSEYGNDRFIEFVDDDDGESHPLPKRRSELGRHARGKSRRQKINPKFGKARMHRMIMAGFSSAHPNSVGRPRVRRRYAQRWSAASGFTDEENQ